MKSKRTAKLALIMSILTGLTLTAFQNCGAPLGVNGNGQGYGGYSFPNPNPGPIPGDDGNPPPPGQGPEKVVYADLDSPRCADGKVYASLYSLSGMYYLTRDNCVAISTTTVSVEADPAEQYVIYNNRVFVRISQ